MGGIVDFHSHLIPGVDDGSMSVQQSLDSLAAFAAQGVTTVVTTPHFDASLTRDPALLERRLGQFDRAWALLTEAAAKVSGLPLLQRGAEVMLDEPDVDLSDPRIRLAGGPFVLCEFPGLRLPPNAEWGVQNLVRRGWRPIVAHPERYRNLDAELGALARLRAAGAVFQMNSGSLLGHYGEEAERVSRRLLALGWVEYLSSDHHARGTPATARAVALLREHGGAQQAVRLTEENPGRMLVGDAPVEVPPVEIAVGNSPWWKRLGSRRS